jgi:hypothetical protein
LDENLDKLEPLAKVLKRVSCRHSGQAERDPESSFLIPPLAGWIPVFAERRKWVILQEPHSKGICQRKVSSVRASCCSPRQCKSRQTGECGPGRASPLKDRNETGIFRLRFRRDTLRGSPRPFSWVPGSRRSRILRRPFREPPCKSSGPLQAPWPG